MTKIGCSASGCVYNKNWKCHKRQISIVGIRARTAENTECINFTYGNSDLYSNEIAYFNASEAKTKVSCTATLCDYNKKYICIKERLAVEGQSAELTEDTFCFSFKTTEKKENHL